MRNLLEPAARLCLLLFEHIEHKIATTLPKNISLLHSHHSCLSLLYNQLTTGTGLQKIGLLSIFNISAESLSSILHQFINRLFRQLNLRKVLRYRRGPHLFNPLHNLWHRAIVLTVLMAAKTSRLHAQSKHHQI